MDKQRLLDHSLSLLARLMSWADPGRLEEWSEMGLTITQIRLLFLLRRNPGATATALANELDVSPPVLTRMVDRLVRHGLVQRQMASDDRRRVCHYLTPKGADTVQRLEDVGRTQLRAVLAQLSDQELVQVVEALERLWALIESQMAASPARHS
ncbi:MAG: MarR family transcriptional regulator [Dehalococcoidia bacterium]|jgi:DNA-binding MarR family transcriptional regulator|nr:MarR family transcriptional regulator [Dehalococcoidia bacterium]MDW8009458.1 MarR family transcriptional regulator [Chloroflexota bacterium]